MRPVNLLPENLRPRQRREGSASGAYAVLGVLGALLLGMVLYVVTANQITFRQAETQRLRGETYAAQQRAGALARFGAFKDMKETRMAAVSQLAAGRFDWERMALELSLVLPAGVWLTELKASATGEQAPGGSGGGGSTSSSSSSSSPSSSPSPTATGEDQTGPSIVLSGCSPTQEAVAEALVRLRRLHQAREVELVVAEREKQQVAGAATPATGGAPTAGAAPAAGAGAGGPEGCGETRGRSNYRFEVKVKLAPTADPTADGGSVPRKLGGGA